MKHFIKQVFSLQFLVSKPLIVLLITAGCGLWTEINAQYRQDRSIIRGNVTSITIKYPGDITTDSLFLQVRTTSSFTSTIHIAKENTVAGGSDAEILATYSYPYTTVKIFFSSANTSGLAIANYYYDLRKSVSPDSAVLIYGTFKIQSYAGEVVNGLAGGGSNESIIKSWIGDSADVIRMELADYVLENDLSDSLDNIRTLIGTGGVALPDSVLFSTDSTAQRTFSDLKYVDKASTQTITGEKTFSGNKTVFGTTTNDSVGIRGNLNVDGIAKTTQIQNTDTTTSLATADRYGIENKKVWQYAGTSASASYGFYNRSLFSLSSGIRLGSHYGFYQETDFGGTGGIMQPNIYGFYNKLIYSRSDTSAAGKFIYNYFADVAKTGIGSFGGQYYGYYSTISSGIINSIAYHFYGKGNYPSYFGGDIELPFGSLIFNNNADTLTQTELGYLDGLESNVQEQLNAMVGGSVGNADSLVGIPGENYSLEKDSLLKVSGDTYKLSFAGASVDYWLGGINSWTDGLSSSSDYLRIGKNYADRRFNSGFYTDFWMIDYVSPPYCLSADWLYPIEHRTDYFNDTIKTMSSVANLLFLDGTGTPLWFNNSVIIAGQETQVNVGDLPDSTALNWANAYMVGNKTILSESNLTATPKRFPMPVKGYEFRFGTNNYYTYPRVYGFYSDLTANSPNLELAYHFYGKGNYPSYFGGNIITDGYIRVQDSIVIGTSTVKIYPDSILVGGTRLAKITEAGALDTSIINDLIEANEDSSGQQMIGTVATLDSIITAFWNDELGGAGDTTGLWLNVYNIVNSLGDGIIGTTATLDSIITDYWNDNLGSTTTLDGLTDVTITTPSTGQVLRYNGTGWANATSTTFDSTYAYQRITALENNVSDLQDSIASFRNILNSILTALDTCGCGVVVTDNTPPAKPTSFVAIGGTSETQYVSTWTDPVDSDLDSIRFYEGSSNDTTALVWVASINKGVETYTRTGRTANTTYWAAVKAIDDSGNVSWFSNLDSAKTLSSSSPTPLVTIDFEEGNLSEWSSTSGANLSASTTFAHTGTYSMRVGTGSFGNYTYGDKDSIYMTFEIYFPSDGSQNATTNYISLFDDGDGDKTSFGTNNSDSDWDEWAVGENSGSLNYIATNFSENTWHTIKLYYKKGTGANARHSVWVDGTLIWSTTTGTAADPTYFVRVGSQTATITNYFYIDDIKLYDENPD